MRVAVLDQGQSANPIALFLPFQLACRTQNPEMLEVAIDCLGKLFSYNYWKDTAGINTASLAEGTKPKVAEEGEDGDATEGMISFVIDTICDGFSGESTDEKVQLQIIKVLGCKQ